MIKSYKDKVKALVHQKLQKVAEEWANETLSIAKIQVPVRTGKLKDSLETAIGNLEAKVGTDVEYGKMVHEGTRRQSANPFLRRAAEIETKGLFKRINDEFK